MNLSGKEKKSEAGNEEEGSYGKEAVGRSTVRIEESLFLPSFWLSDNLLSFQLCLSDCCAIYHINFLYFHI